MPAKQLEGGIAHDMPADLQKALLAKPKATAAWESLTPLARNEWICWNTAPKQEATRQEHIKRSVEELQEGKRRPCCWAGCWHRTDKPLSPTGKWMLDKQTKAAQPKAS